MEQCTLWVHMPDPVSANTTGLLLGCSQETKQKDSTTDVLISLLRSTHVMRLASVQPPRTNTWRATCNLTTQNDYCSQSALICLSLARWSHISNLFHPHYVLTTQSTVTLTCFEILLLRQPTLTGYQCWFNRLTIASITCLLVREGGREGREREGGWEAGREGGREGRMEGGREGGKGEGGREGGRDGGGGREGRRDGGREGGRAVRSLLGPTLTYLSSYKATL